MTHPDPLQQSPSSPPVKVETSDTGHPSAHAHPVSGDVFPPAELAILHAEDKSAAAQIVGLMLGIFTIGIILYLTVCYFAAAS